MEKTLRGDPKCGHGKQAIIIALITQIHFICLLTVTKLISITYNVFLLKKLFLLRTCFDFFIIKIQRLKQNQIIILCNKLT